MSLNLQMSAVLCRHRETSSLQQMEIITQAITENKFRVVEHNPNGYTYKTTPAPKVQQSLKVEEKMKD